MKSYNAFHLLWLLVFGLVCLASAPPGAAQPNEDLRLDWWRQARFGMFIHWGPVSLRGTEIGWSRGNPVPVEDYDALYRSFNPTRFDAAAWVRIAKETGMKYLVLTSKHHDGFSLWDTRVSDYNIMRTPFARDVIRELAAACRKQNIVFATYYSICDWYHPDYPLGSPGGKSKKPEPNMDRYTVFLKGQLKELISQYGPLGILWFDGEWESPWTTERGIDLYQYVRGLQPDIIVNNRVGKGRAGMEGITRAGEFAGDYDTPEQQIGTFQNKRPWESCITLCRQWAWKPDDQLKSLKECLQTLVACVGGDGNLLLNVGPMPSGEIEPRQVERLREIGQWLGQYGESIYDTRGGPFQPGAWGASTHRDNLVYLHVFGWNGAELTLPPIDKKITGSRVLTGGRAEIRQNDQSLRVTLAPEFQREIDTLIRLELDGPASQLAPVPVPAASPVKEAVP